MPRTANSGFTLLEFVLLITILGVLSALSVSRYIDIRNQARTAAAQGIYGALRTAASLAKAACFVQTSNASDTHTCTETGGTVNMDGVNVTMANEFPTATAGGIITAAQIDVTDRNLNVNYSGNAVTIDINGGVVPNCRIRYQQAPAGSIPTITLTTTGC